jgi:formin 2
VLVLSFAIQPPADSVQPIVYCHTVVGQQTRVVCNAAGIIVLNQVVNVPTVTLPPVTGPTVTVPVPGHTETVHVPGPTIKEPGSTETIYEPGETVTEHSTVTAQPSSLPSPSTITVSPSGQPGTTGGTVVPTPDQGNSITTIYRNIPGPLKTVGISTLALLLLVGLLLLGMWLGYILGYKDSDRANARFMQALRDKMLIRGKHS